MMPVGVYRPISSSGNRTRFDVNAERGLTPFVGRQGDLEVILKAFQRSKEGSGQAVAVTSDPGMGKSRLLYEFRKSITNEDVFFLEGKCLSFSRTVAYHPVIDILKSLFHIDEKQTDSQIREKLATGLSALKLDSRHSLPYLLELLAVKDSGVDMVKTSPEARREWINAALISMVVAQAQQKPLILVIEDLHWVDAASQSAISELLGSIHAERVLLLITYRAEFVPDWRTGSNFHQVVLGRLSEDNSLSMACHLLETQAVGSDIARQILEKTEGVPFYIEEFVRSLKDFNIIWNLEEDTGQSGAEALRIPSTIQDIIMARVDILPEAARQIIKTGSVIEREFSRQLISMATGLEPESLAAGLTALKEAELIYQRGAGAEAAYYFNHALRVHTGKAYREDLVAH
jgi:predicted ATPase